MSDIGRISGAMLKANLLRGGVDLVFEDRLGDNLLYLDVNSSKIGINTDEITRELLVNDTIKTTDLLVDESIFIQDLKFNISSIESTNNLIFLPQSGTTNLTALSTSGIKIDNNVISTLNSNETLEFRPNGTGEMIINSNTKVYADLHSSGNITLDGNITFGNNDTDSVTFVSDIDSNIVPDTNEFYNLGSTSKRWLNTYTELINGQLLETSGISVSGVNDIALRQGKIWYVATNGLDSNVGDHQNGPFATVRKALSESTNGDTVLIYPGTYEETFPLTVPAGVTVRGMGLRSVKIIPTSSTNHLDAFLLNGETTVSDLTVADFFYNNTNNTGYAFKFDNNFTVTSRSPYVQNVSVITNTELQESRQITPGPGPTLFGYTSDSVNVDKTFYSQVLVDSLIGQVAVIDRYPNPPLFYNIISIETEPLNSGLWRITFDTTFDTSGYLKPISFYSSIASTLIITNDIWDTSGSSIGENWVAYFKTNLPANFETTVQPGWMINVAGTLYEVDYIIEDPVNSNQWRIYVTTSLVGGTGIPIFSSPTASTTLLAGRGAYIDGSVATTSSKEASMLFHSVTMIVPGADAVVMTNGVRVEWLNSFIYYANRGLYAINGTLGLASQGGRFGAEIRSIGSANVYGTFGAVADGANTLMYLINHNFAYIGSGLSSTNDPSNVIPANETVELNSGKIYYQSLDHKGTYRVGDVFTVNLETGEISIDGISTSLGNFSTLNFVDEDSEIFIDATTVDVNNIRISENTMSSISGDINFLSQSSEINLTQNVNISKNLDISNDFIIKGQLTVGNQIIDTVNFVSKLDEDLIPKFDNAYLIGSNSLKWDAFNIQDIRLDNLKIYENRIRTSDTNADLELTANSLGNIRITNSSAEFDQDLTTNGLSQFNDDINIIGNLVHVGSVFQTGNVERTGNYLLNGNLLLSTNFNFENIRFVDNRIFTNVSNSDLELKAAGTGLLNILNDNVRLDQNLTVIDLTSTSNITNSNTVTSGQFLIDDILIKDNFITTRNSNSNLEFLAEGTGGVFLEQLKFTNNTISTESGNTNINIASLSAGSVFINDEKALKIPVGTGAARLVGVQGDFRYDSTDNLFSGWSSNRVTFGGVFSADRRTNVTAHPTNDTLNFVANLVATMEITQTGIRSNGLGTDNTLLFNGNIISSLTANTDINLSPNGTGQTDLGDFHIYQNEFINQPNTPLTLVTTAGGHVKFSGTKAVQIPFGPSSTRPFTEIGDLRWNTDSNSTEIFDGINYVSIAGVTESASPEQVQELNEIYAILLG